MDFHGMKPAQARAFVETWVATWPQRQAWLEAQPGVGPVDLSRDFIARLDAWAAPQLKEAPVGHPHTGDLPLWSEPGNAPAVTVESLWLVDAVALALGESVIANALAPGFRWAAGDYPRRRANYALQNWPVVNKGEVGVEFSPLWRCQSWMNRHLHGGPPLPLVQQFDWGIDPNET